MDKEKNVNIGIAKLKSEVRDIMGNKLFMPRGILELSGSKQFEPEETLKAAHAIDVCILRVSQAFDDFIKANDGVA